MTTEDRTINELIRGTLAWCNGIRKDKGQPPLDELPKGFRHDPGSCPCGNATGVYVGSSVWAENMTELEVMDFTPGYGSFSTEHSPRGQCGETPDVVRRFVRAFDMAELPELIDR